MKCSRLTVGFVALAMCTLAARAQTTTWIPSTGNWSVAGNWDTGVPVAGGTAVFDSNVTSTVDAAYTIANLNLNSGIVTLASSSGSLAITGATTYAGGGPDVIAANISGAGTMNVEGGSSLTLSGTNTYTGATTIVSGTLQAGSTSAFGNLSLVTMSGTGTLSLGSFNNGIGSLTGAVGNTVNLGSAILSIGSGSMFDVNTTYAGAIIGIGGITINDYTGTLTLTGASNTYSGTTTISQGEILVSGNGTIGTGNLAMVANATFAFSPSAPATFSNLISGVGTVEDLNSTVTLSGANTYGGITKVMNGTLIAGSSMAFGHQASLQLTGSTVNLNGNNVGVGSITGDSASTINLGANTLTIQNSVANTVFAGALIGAGGAIDIIVTSNLDLTGNANTFSGGMTIGSGNVYADNSNSADSATGTGPVTIGVGGSLTIGNDSATGYIVNLPITNNGILDFARTDAIAFPNQITGTGGVELQDGGMITLSGDNTYTGLTNIDMATLLAGSSTALGGGTTALSFNSAGGTLDLNGNDISVGSIEGGGLGTIVLGSNTLTIGGVSGTTTFNGGITSSTGGGITVNGPGTQYLTSTSNTYNGYTVINSGGTLGLGFSSQTGNIPNTAGVSGSGTLLFYEGSAVTFAPEISGSVGVTQSSSLGPVTLSGSNTYSGPTTINAGILIAGSGNAFGGNAGESAVTINGTGELNLNGFSNTIGSLSGSATSSVVLGGATLSIDNIPDPTYLGTISGGALDFEGNATVILDGNNTGLTGITIQSYSALQVGDGVTAGAAISGPVDDEGSLVFEPATTDNITFSGAISGAGSVTAQGLGEINLSGANSYQGEPTSSLARSVTVPQAPSPI